MSQKRRVLVIEDDQDSRELMMIRIQNMGYSVEGAPTGEIGLSLIEQQDFDAVVVDILLPGIDGWEVIRRIRKLDASRRLPIIISTIVDFEQSSDVKVDAYLTKPYTADQVESAVNRVLAEAS